MSEARRLPGWSLGTHVRRNPYWMIAKRRRGRFEVLTTEMADGRRTLPVFSFEDEAALYLRHGIRGSWQLRRTQAGELVSLLCSLCSNVELVTLDPMPELETDVVIDLVSLERESFVSLLLRREVSATLPPGHSRVPRLANGGVCAQTKGATL